MLRKANTLANTVPLVTLNVNVICRGASLLKSYIVYDVKMPKTIHKSKRKIINNILQCLQKEKSEKFDNIPQKNITDIVVNMTVGIVQYYCNIKRRSAAVTSGFYLPGQALNFCHCHCSIKIKSLRQEIVVPLSPYNKMTL